MSSKPFAMHLGAALIGANALFLIWFWWYFFAHASPHQAGPPAWEQAAPWAVVLNRGLGSSLSVPELKSIPIFQAAFLVYVPCFVVTWPLGRFLSSEFYVLGTNPQGLRLIAVTALSFVQWTLLLRISTALVRWLQRRDHGSPGIPRIHESRDGRNVTGEP